jgi:TetR/AcrR family transcriptional repressor of nem operon
MSDKNTRERLIDAAFDEIYSKGYQGAALTDILAKAGVHKGSMYHFFANKKEMALAAIDEKIHARFSMKYDSIAELESGHLDRFFETLTNTALLDLKRGCPIANIVQEMSNLDSDFDKLMKSLYVKFRHGIKDIFDKAVKAKEMKECDTTRMALFAAATMEGAILSAKASGETSDYIVPIEELIKYLQTYKKGN